MNEDDFAQLAALRNQQQHEAYERMNATNVGKPVSELQARIERLEAALQWYANENNWLFRYDADVDDMVTSAERDGGERARKALGEQT